MENEWKPDNNEEWLVQCVQSSSYIPLKKVVQSLWRQVFGEHDRLMYYGFCNLTTLQKVAESKLAFERVRSLDKVSQLGPPTILELRSAVSSFFISAKGALDLASEEFECLQGREKVPPDWTVDITKLQLRPEADDSLGPVFAVISDIRSKTEFHQLKGYRDIVVHRLMLPYTYVPTHRAFVLFKYDLEFSKLKRLIPGGALPFAPDDYQQPIMSVARQCEGYSDFVSKSVDEFWAKCREWVSSKYGG